MLFNQILNPRLTSPLVRLFGMKTGGNPAPTVAPEVQPTHNVNQMDDGGIFFLRGERIMGGAASVAAGGAATYAKISLRNPTASGVLLILDAVAITSTSQIWGVLLAGNTNLTNVENTGIADARWLLSGSSYQASAVLSSEASAGTIAGNAFVRLGASSPAVQPIRAVVPPGYRCIFWTVSQNVAIDSFFVSYRERAVAAEELATG